MKKTVLQITQNILNDMDSDEVNDIDDTAEARQVAEIVGNVYEEMMNSRHWPHLATLTTLIPFSDSTQPTHMILNEDTQRIMWIKYNKIESGQTQDAWTTITRRDPVDFLDLVTTRDNTDADVDVITDPSGVELQIRTDQGPNFWTSFDDEVIVFDAYDKAVDTTLQASKTSAYVLRETTFTVANDHIPDLPAKLFPMLIAQAKATAFEAFKQTQNVSALTQERRMRTFHERERWRQNGGIQFPDFGRRSVGGMRITKVKH